MPGCQQLFKPMNGRLSLSGGKQTELPQQAHIAHARTNLVHSHADPSPDTNKSNLILKEFSSKVARCSFRSNMGQ